MSQCVLLDGSMLSAMVVKHLVQVGTFWNVPEPSGPLLISGSPTSSYIHSTENNYLHCFQSSNKLNYSSIFFPESFWLSSKAVILNRGCVNWEHLGSF